VIFPGILNLGLNRHIKKIKATVLVDRNWLESFERSRKSFGLENLSYQYWTYPDTKPEGTLWILNRKKAALLVSEGFLKTAEESQVALLMSHLSAQNFNQVRHDNQRQALQMFFNSIKGESNHYRFWVISFFLYPLERFLKIARI